MASTLADAEPGGRLAASAEVRERGAGRMSRGQLVILFGYSLVPWTIGNGMLPLLPKYAGGLGADDVLIGIFLAISYASIALGTATAGWVADRMGRHGTLMVLVGLATVPFFLLTSRITVFWEAVVVTSFIWWLGGMSLTFAIIVAGLWAGPEERGRVLGVVAAAAPAGSILGGLGVGVLADELGFSTLWIALGLLYLACPAIGTLVRDVPEGRAQGDREVSGPAMWSAAFLILLVSGLLGAAGSFMGQLGRSLAMQDFSNADLTSTVAVSGLATLPFPFLLGSLSDRLGRLRFLALCFAAGIAGLLVYSGATLLWQFWLATALVGLVAFVSAGVGSALVVDLVDRPSVGRGLALFNMTGWAGGILGFAAGGYVFGEIGYAGGFLVGALLLVVAALLLPPIARAMRSPRRARSRVERA